MEKTVTVLNPGWGTLTDYHAVVGKEYRTGIMIQAERKMYCAGFIAFLYNVTQIGGGFKQAVAMGIAVIIVVPDFEEPALI